MKSLIDQSGLVGESDFISLSETISISRNFMNDQVVGTRHKLHPLASKVLKKLDRPIEYKQWLTQSQKLGLSRVNIDELLLFVNDIGGLCVKKSLPSKIKTQKLKIKLMSRGILPPALGQRLPVGMLSLCKSILSSMNSLFIAIILLAILAYGVNFNLNLFWKIAVIFVAIIWVSTYFHELTHMLILSRNRNKIVILRRGTRIGILHRSLNNRTELSSAICGPLVGSLFAFCLSVAMVLALNVNSLVLGIGVLVSLMQLISFWPSYGDGKVVWKSLKGINT